MAIAKRLALLVFAAAVTASGQGGNASSPEDATSAARRASDCNEGGSWRLYTDADVRAKLGCRSASWLTIEGPGVTSLADLRSFEGASRIWIDKTSLVSLEGLEGCSVALEVGIGDNPNLESLKGLEGLGFVSRFFVNTAPSLTSIEALQGLRSLDTFYLGGLPMLTSLTGLGSLTSVEYFTIERCGITSLEGLGNLTTVSTHFIIEANERLESFTGLDSLTNVGGGFLTVLPGTDGLDVRDNPALSSLSGLENLATVIDITISGNNNLLSLSGLESVTGVRNLKILDNQELQSLTGLEGLTSVNGTLTMENNLKIASLSGLRNLRKAEEFRLVGRRGDHWTEHTDGPRDLSGLENLQSVTGELEIAYWHFDQLTSLVGLSSLTSVGELTLHFLRGVQSLAGLESLATVGLISIWLLGDDFSLEGLALHSALLLRVKGFYYKMTHLGGPFVSGASVGAVDIDDSAWPTCVTPHERMALVAAVANVKGSFIPAGVTAYPIIAPLPRQEYGPPIAMRYIWRNCAPATFGTFSCATGQPCNVSIPGEEGIFVSGRFTGCGRCPESQRHTVTEDGTVDLGLALLKEEGGLRSLCRCADVGGPVAQLLLRGPRASGLTVCSRGQNCSFRVEGEALEHTDHVVLMRQCGDGNPLFSANWTAENVYLLHDSAWYAAAPTRYQVCWRAPCNSTEGSPACSAPWDGYFHVGEVDLFGVYSSIYEVLSGEGLSVPNVGLGVSGADRMRLMRFCGKTSDDGADSLEADNSGPRYNFGWLTNNRTGAGSYRLCWCQARNGVKCDTDWHFTAESGRVWILCPPGQELARRSQRCSTCPAGRQSLQRGLERCLDCPAGQFSASGEPCEACPDGTSAALPGSTRCAACLNFESANDQATDCVTDSPKVFLLASFLVFLGAFWVTFALSIRRYLSVVDVSLNHGRTVVTILHSHGFANFGCKSFPVHFRRTGHPGLDNPLEPLRARVQDAVRLELLTEEGGHIQRRLDTSRGTLIVDFPYDYYHQKNCTAPIIVVLPVLLGATMALGLLVLQSSMVTEGLLGGGGVLVLSTLVSVILRVRSHSTPLRERLHDFKQVLAEQNPNPVSCTKGPQRALTVGKLFELLDFFRDFIRDRTAYYMDTNILHSLTKSKRLSYAELVGPAQVEWFVSHYWGTAFEHFCAALHKHAESVCGNYPWTECSYWVCFCSNNQHQIKDELGGGWADSSFYLTLRSGYCQGTCMVLDDEALPLTRIWCIFELLQTVKLQHSQEGFEGLLLCTSGGVLNSGGGSVEVAMALAKRVGEMDLQRAQATSENDASMIRTQVMEEMGSFDALNHFVTAEVRDMLLQAQRNSNQQFGAVLAVLDGVLANTANTLGGVLAKTASMDRGDRGDTVSI